MNKCLVTKLMGAVSDETIPLLGYQQFAFSSSKKGKNEDFKIAASYNNKPFKLVGDGYLIGKNGESLGKETTQEVAGIYINSLDHFFINIPNGFRRDSVLGIVLGENAYLKIEEVSVEQVLKIAGNSPQFYPQFFIKTNKISGDITKLISLWTSGNFAIRSDEISNDAYGNLDNVVINGEDENKLYVYNITLSNIPKLTGNLESLLDKFAQHTNYGSSPTAHNMTFSLFNTPLVKYKGESIGKDFNKTFTMQTNNTWIEV